MLSERSWGFTLPWHKSWGKFAFLKDVQFPSCPPILHADFIVYFNKYLDTTIETES